MITKNNEVPENAHGNVKDTGSDHSFDTGSDNLRGRAAWMYYVEQMTQSQIAERLSIGRITVQRLLAESRRRREVVFTVTAGISSLVGLERELESAFNLQQASVAPVSSIAVDPMPAISAATGSFISTHVIEDMSLGVGWGRTLYGALDFITGRPLNRFHVVSLLGGIVQARRFNPAEFAWQLAERFQGEGFLLPAPAIVDSPETRTALVNHCGLDTLFDMAENLDAVLLSIGHSNATSTSYSVGYLDNDQRQSLIDAGAVGDLLFHFFDRQGELVDHEINQRVMSIGIDSLIRTPLRILASGGRNKQIAMLGAMRLLQPNVLITDEHTARFLLHAYSSS